VEDFGQKTVTVKAQGVADGRLGTNGGVVGTGVGRLFAFSLPLLRFAFGAVVFTLRLPALALLALRLPPLALLLLLTFLLLAFLFFFGLF
jgi:hypothetical protein